MSFFLPRSFRIPDGRPGISEEFTSCAKYFFWLWVFLASPFQLFGLRNFPQPIGTLNSARASASIVYRFGSR
jgi:hypothetical protein